MNYCPNCSRNVPISKALPFCASCIKSSPEKFLPQALLIHKELRKKMGMVPYEIPRNPDGILCKFCQNACQIADGEYGFCRVRKNINQKLSGGIKSARVIYYHDRLPTNCVASWVCPAEAKVGYPKWSYALGAEYGYYNLAVFYEACSFHCLNCQNWHFRKADPEKEGITPKELADALTPKDACICYFGGDPTPFLVHSLKSSKLALEKNKKILRICWETNGSMKTSFLKAMIKIALKTGGIIKFDLKAYDENLHKAIAGVSNKQTLSNFAILARRNKERKDYPLVCASTLLIPGLIDEEEIFNLSRMIASIDPDIPYALLAFHPDCYLSDLPCTSKDQAYSSLNIAEKAGLRNVRLGNIHLVQ